MARHVKVPTHILDSKISASAKLLWIEFARVATPKRPQVSANTQLLAERMGLSVRTIRRLILELLRAELLVHSGYVDGRVRVYKLTLNPSPVTGEGLKSNSPSPLGGKGAEVSFYESLTPEILESWAKRFPVLDGRSGRPSLVQCVGEALLHPMRDKNADPKAWVETMLKNTSRLYRELEF